MSATRCQVTLTLARGFGAHRQRAGSKCGKPVTIFGLCRKHQADRERLTIPPTP